MIADTNVLIPNGCHLHYDHVLQLEALGPAGRYSIFTPKKLLERNKVLKDMPLHWSSLHNPMYQKEFLQSDEVFLDNRTVNACKYCPLVLAKSKREVLFFDEALRRFNLTFQLVYAEEEFESTLRHLLDKKKPFLVFHWSHELPEFALIQPPPCEEMKFSSHQCRNEGVCPLEPMTSMKIVSDTMSKVSIAYQALMEVYFGTKDIQNLFGFLKKDQRLGENNYNNAACNWMKENSKQWNKWQPIVENDGKIDIRLAVYVPESLSESHAIMKAFERALQDGNTQLKRVQLDLIREKDLCDVPGYASLLTQKLSRVRPDGLIGPSCNKNLMVVAGKVIHLIFLFSALSL